MDNTVVDVFANDGLKVLVAISFPLIQMTALNLRRMEKLSEYLKIFELFQYGPNQI